MYLAVSHIVDSAAYPTSVIKCCLVTISNNYSIKAARLKTIVGLNMPKCNATLLSQSFELFGAIVYDSNW